MNNCLTPSVAICWNNLLKKTLEYSLLALADPPLDRRVGLQTQVFCGCINAKCQKGEWYECILVPRQWCPIQRGFKEFQQEALVSQPNWSSYKLHGLYKWLKLTKTALKPGSPIQANLLRCNSSKTGCRMQGFLLRVTLLSGSGHIFILLSGPQ